MVLLYERGDPMRLLIAHPSASFAGKLLEKFTGEFETRWVSDGAEALESLNCFCPEVLILHLSMPRKDGLTLLEQTSHRPEIIVATTDYLDSFVAAAVHKHGGVVLVMPMVSTVVGWVDTLLQQSRFFVKEEQVVRLLHELGFRPSLTGYKQLRMAAEYLKKDPGQKLSGEVYGRIGEPRAVEKAIRTAIHAAWREGERQVWKKYFGATCPGNKTFLLTLLQTNLHSLTDDHTAFGDMAVHGQYLHTGFGGFPQGSAEVRVGGVVGVEKTDIFHLNDEQHIGAEPLFCQSGQLPKVTGAPDGGGIGESAHTVLLQGDTFYF